MLGMFKIARRARQWRAERQRKAMENLLYRLPLELQKDIGWPLAEPRYPAKKVMGDTRASPIV